MKNWLIVLTLSIIILCSYFIYHEIKYEAQEIISEHPDFFHPKSKSIKNIQDKCGILGTDLLWTTAMDKISKCIDAPAIVYINGDTYSIPRDGRVYNITYKKGK